MPCKGSLNRNQPCVESRCEPGRCLFCQSGMPDREQRCAVCRRWSCVCNDADDNAPPIHPSDLRGLRFRP